VNLKHVLGNTLWTISNARAYRLYRSALRDPRGAQEEILFRFLRKNSETLYGRKYEYASIRSVEEFQSRVPMVTYDDLKPWVRRIYHGRPNVLTGEPVLMLEKTSGSSGAVKYIPYTESLRREFQNAIGAWIFDLFTRRMALLGGAQYWSISPSAREREVTPGRLPVGFEEDTEYLTPLEREVIGWVMAVPGSVARIQNMEENRRVTIRHLLRCRNLRFISVWNPSFLTLLMSRLPEGAKPLDLWPNLALISCWTSAVSARFLPDLRALFPGVEIQGKGLLATEGVVSFPEIGRRAPSPAITSHFLEFVDEKGRARLVDELETGARYSVVMTTGGGFARYALQDLVEVVSAHSIEFVGKSGLMSDLCGEKLSEGFVGRVLEEASSRFGLNGFALLAPEWNRPPRYVLFVESEPNPIARFVEERLRASVHYDYCRKLGQLAPVEGVRVVQGSERYLRGCEALGQKPGNVKPAYLRKEFGWRARLEPSNGC